MPYLMKLMTKPMYKNLLMTCESESDKDEKDQVDVPQTYCANYMVPDSAATASAMYSGVKTTFFTMGYNSRYSFYTIAKRPKTYLSGQKMFSIYTGIKALY